MSTLSVRDVSEETLTALRSRAAANRQSLQAFIRDVLDREAFALSIEKAARKAELVAMRNDVATDDVIEAIEAARHGRR